VTDFQSEANGPDVTSDNRAAPAVQDAGGAGVPDMDVAGAGMPGAKISNAGWADALSDDNRALVEAKAWHGEEGLELNSALDAYRSLEARLGRSIPVPGEDATPGEWDAFERRLGRPDTPEGYDFELPQGLPDDFPYSEDLAGRFRDWAFRAGMPATAAQSLHDDYVRELAGLQRAEAERLSDAEDRSHRELVSAWGEADGEDYRRNVMLADRAMHRLGLNEVLQETGLIAVDGGVRDARVAKALARVGSELFAEDSLHGSAGGGDNPFAGDNPNLTEQSRLIREARSDPSKAALVQSLMQAAGIDPAAQRI
jgi:hypothetical protein